MTTCNRILETFGPIAFLVTLLTGFAVHAGEIPQDVKDNIQARVDAGRSMSVVVGLVDADGVTYYSYGKMAASDDTLPDENTVYEIGSISKVFTAILLADAVKRGEVKYDDSIETHLPKDATVRGDLGKEITLEHLSVQTSGLPRMPSNFRPADPLNPYVDYSVDDLYKALSKQRIRKEVGESYDYSNYGVALLGHLLERASGKTYEELTVERIADVVGMPDTTITLTEDMQSRLATGHADGKEVLNWDLPTFAGAGAIRSTAKDMIAFLQANLGLNDTPLLDTMRETHSPRAEAGSKQMHIGLGWHIFTLGSGPVVTWHNGGTGGYRSYAGFTQDPPRGVVVLTNSAGEGSDDLGFHLLNDAFPMDKIKK
jgi:serine-type D-Ala-D-Ala carboxypeptidase/endopeptidase